MICRQNPGEIRANFWKSVVKQWETHNKNEDNTVDIDGAVAESVAAAPFSRDLLERMRGRDDLDWFVFCIKVWITWLLMCFKKSGRIEQLKAATWSGCEATDPYGYTILYCSMIIIRSSSSSSSSSVV